MHAVKDWNEEMMKWLAVGMCLVMVGMAVMPCMGVGIGEAWAVGGYLLEKNSENWNAEAGLGWSISGLIVSSLYGAAVGAAVGAAPGAVVGFGIGL
ncbi:MAG: hypothetical protein H0Z19_08865 [Archaeoglobus sp.]|uniref:hypothetical protein n=1 Tax=Archaeoglobus sp. TaxID=1872626 RepID=UPI001D2AE092|nr:hypothetical protein [Archaeoglobus sp.]MBO8180567.1 hypothetical protein [Archaeoglobus sp.]